MTRGRNINLLSIALHRSVQHLGPPNPWMIVIAKETLGFRCAGISPALWLLMPTFSLLSAPASLTTHLYRKEDAPLPRAPSELGAQPYLRYQA